MTKKISFGYMCKIKMRRKSPRRQLIFSVSENGAIPTIWTIKVHSISSAGNKTQAFHNSLASH